MASSRTDSRVPLIFLRASPRMKTVVQYLWMTIICNTAFDLSHWLGGDWSYRGQPHHWQPCNGRLTHDNSDNWMFVDGFHFHPMLLWSNHQWVRSSVPAVVLIFASDQGPTSNYVRQRSVLSPIIQLSHTATGLGKSECTKLLACTLYLSVTVPAVQQGGHHA